MKQNKSFMSTIMHSVLSVANISSSKTIFADQLPMSAKSFITNHFQGKSIAFVEEDVDSKMNGYKAYKQGGVLSKIGQWNTHTYSGSNADRVHMAFLAHQDKMPLWMSEVGAGGNGIGGNLSLTQKLFDDMRYLQPETWIDWQYMEEANDQWCTIRGSFKDQSYARVMYLILRNEPSST